MTAAVGLGGASAFASELALWRVFASRSPLQSLSQWSAVPHRKLFLTSKVFYANIITGNILVRIFL